MEAISREGRREGEFPFAVCFEVEPAAERLGQYLTVAGNLRPELDRIPGFESIERSRSVHAKERLLSLSYWSNEAAIVAWRSHGLHHEAQVLGRHELFADYRLRVGQVIRRWSPERIPLVMRPAAPDLPGKRLKSPNEKNLLGLLCIEGLNQADHVAASFTNGSVEFERYESMVNRERAFFVVSLADEDAGRAVEAHLRRAAAAAQDQGSMRIVLDTCEIQRDYGRFERTQAPQYFRPVQQPEV